MKKKEFLYILFLLLLINITPKEIYPNKYN